jgi:hypothetical protein
MINVFAGQRPGERPLHARAVVAWGLAAFVGFQALFFGLARRWPQLHDPEFGGKLANLRARLAESPKGRRLILILGSSHTGMGIRPDALPALGLTGPQAPLVYNFSINNSGPLTSLLCLRRLLAEGVHPDWVVVEPCPLMLWLEGARAQVQASLRLDCVQWRDLPVLARYYPRPHQFRVQWRAIQYLPWFYHRNALLSYVCPTWLPRDERLNNLWGHTDSWGWQWVEGYTDPAFAANPAVRDNVYTNSIGFYKVFVISDTARQALREVVATCRKHGCAVALLRMPEAREFLSWYPPAIRAQIDACLTQVSRDFDIPLIDGRHWVADTCFADGQHLTPDGAIACTQQFVRWVVQPIMEGQRPGSGPPVLGQAKPTAGG